MNIYLDNNATTQPLPAVVEAMVDCLVNGFANPSSLHLPGRRVKAKIEQAREHLAALIGCQSPSEVIFTSGGTESINVAFFMAAQSWHGRIPHIVVSAVEHAAVLDAAKFYALQGVKIDIIGVDQHGNLDLDELRAVLAKASQGCLVSLMLANNETGTLFPIREIAQLCRQSRALFHVDAVQAMGKVKIDVKLIDCDFLSLSGHKFHGPKGVGALYLRHGIALQGMIKGHQENGLRGGTENVPGIIGMGVAAQAAFSIADEDFDRLKDLRNRLEFGILAAVPGAQVNGHQINRLCNTSNIFFPGKNAATLVEQLSSRGVHVSAGAACTTGGRPSHVLRAMGLGDERSNASLRFSLCQFTTPGEIEEVIPVVRHVVLSSPTVHAVN